MTNRIAPTLLHPLTPRQRQILQAFVEQPNDRRVARQLGVAPQTVANQLSRIQKLLRVAGRVELIKLVLETPHELASVSSTLHS